MKVYILVENIYDGGYGCDMAIKGIFTTEEKLDKYCNENKIDYKHGQPKHFYWLPHVYVAYVDDTQTISLGGHKE